MPSHSHIHISFLILPRLTKTKASLCPSSYLIMNHRKRFHCNNYVFIYLYYIQNYNLTTETAIRNLANGDMGWIAFDLCVCVCAYVLCMCVCFSNLMISVCMSCFTCFTRLSWAFAHTHAHTDKHQSTKITNTKQLYARPYLHERPQNRSITYIYSVYFGSVPRRSTHQDTSPINTPRHLLNINTTRRLLVD